jgi:3-keto-disaccharide hydrolase
MRPTLRGVIRLTASCGIVAAVFAQGQKMDFEKDEVGKPPKGFSFALTGQGRPGVWVVKTDDQSHGNVLVQTDADKTDYRFPLAVYDGLSAKDVTLTVSFKPISGRGDQGAGLIWRYQDANNYYVTRCNALENNCTIYHVVKGSRKAFASKGVKVATGTWHTLRMQAAGEHFVVTYDGQTVLDTKDATFANSGKVGLWTKADSVIAFDDFTIEGK